MQAKVVDNVPGVKGIHHVHVWGLTPQDLMLTMHVSLDDGTAEPTTLIPGVKAVVKREYGIGHSTIEIELDNCADDSEHLEHDHAHESPGSTAPI